MTSYINLEIKDRVAKLLATEDIIIEHNNKASTASFNVSTRVLTLPVWSKASNDVYDMLIAHEVGHALFTPNDEWVECKINKSYVNILEDVRIEKLMKRKYAGIAKSFYCGYKDLNDNDFFGISNKNLLDYIFIDRININYKIGHFIDVPFFRAEREMLNMADQMETFDDVLKLAEKICNYCKKYEPKFKTDIDYKSTKGGSYDCGSYSIEDTDNDYDSNNDNLHSDNNKDCFIDDEDEKKPKESEKPCDNVQEDGNGETGSECDQEKSQKEKDQAEPDPQTIKILEDALEQLCDTEYSTKYLEIPNIDPDTYTISYGEVFSDLNRMFTKESYVEDYNEFYNKLMSEETSYRNLIKQDIQKSLNRLISTYDKGIELSLLQYEKFKVDAKKEVSFLVKEFESKKSANAYNRSLTAKTGVLDCRKLHTYKYSEDIFQKITITPDAKSHGLIFILDWSGSMSSIMSSTIRQLYYLVWFCKKVKIPFDVYAFSSNLEKRLSDRFKKSNAEKYKFYIRRGNGLLHLLTSKDSSQNIEKQMQNIYKLISFQYGSFLSPDRYKIYKLMGTPFNEALMMLPKLITRFKTENSVQKVHVSLLTDGFSSDTSYYGPDLRFHSTKIFNKKFFLRNRNTKKIYYIDSNLETGITNALLRSLCDEFKDTNFMGFRLMNNSRDFFKVIVNNYSMNQQVFETFISQKKDEYIKYDSIVLTDTPYSVLFILNSKTLYRSESEIFSRQGDTILTKSQIKSQFLKHFRNKRKNKRMLNEFINCII